MCLQRASSDQSAVSSSTQHDNEHVCGDMAPFTALGDEGPAEHMARDMEVGCAQEPADLLYTTATFHYSRHQGAHHRPAVRWKSDTDMHESAHSCHSPQHSMLSPNKSCMKQRPEGYTLWFSEVQPDQSCASIRPWGSCLKSIDGGKQGSQMVHGRKRSRLRSID